MNKKKFYVVWQGVEPGIYDSWDTCKAQVFGYKDAQYKSFPTRMEAEKAFSENPRDYLAGKQQNLSFTLPFLPPDVEKESIAVDAACSGNPGKMEYRGVWIGDGLEMFRVGPYEEGTNNIGEFLAIVHALALLQNTDKDIPIYTDSVNAIKWIQKKKCNTKLPRTDKNKSLFDVIARAERWLASHSYSTRILKWETRSWGEIPADFGRK